jgi:hypothetical protein
MRVATLACIHFHSDIFHNAYGYLLKKMEGLLIETETDTTVIKKMKKVTRENIRRRYENNQGENECMPVLPLASIQRHEYNIIKPVHF